MSSAPLISLSRSDAEHYREDGVLCLRGLFRAWVEPLREAIERNLGTPGPLGTRYGKAEHKGTFHGDRYMWTFDEGFRRFALEGPGARIAGELMGATKVNLFYDHLLVKEPGAEAPTPWHQDLPYWCVEGTQICSIWLALDPVSRDNGVVEFVRGSHLWDRQFQGMDFRFRQNYSAELEPMPDIDADRARYDILSWDMAPGDCVVFDARTIHGSPGNSRPDRRRRALSVRWLGDDVRYRIAADVTLPIRDPGLKHGDPVDCDLFPIVWRREPALAGR
jgi:ectoine hydroxylase-related dioxygenase (phytanoyl-CoA dioxygenase family)